MGGKVWAGESWFILQTEYPHIYLERSPMLINWEELSPVEVLDEVLYGITGVPRHILEAWVAIIASENDLNIAEINRWRIKIIDFPGDPLEYLDETTGELSLNSEQEQ